MSMFATPRTPDVEDGLGKDALLDALCVFTPTSYDAETKTKYGFSATLLAHVVIVDGDHAGEVEPRFYCAGNLAHQIGDGLDVGAKAPGRIRKGKSANGKDWYGIEWTSLEADVAAAEAAVLRAEGNAPAAVVPPAPAAAPAVADDLPPF